MLVFSSCTCTNKQTYDYESYGLNCPVKSVKVNTYEAESKFGEIVKGDLAWDGHYLAIFNEVGNLESITDYDDDGDLSLVTKYKYNVNNQIAEVSYYSDDGDLRQQIICAYDNNQITSNIYKTYWNDEEEITEHRQKWNGEQLVERIRIKNGELQVIVKYPEHNKNYAEWVEYDKDGKEISRGDETFDNNGRVVCGNYGELHMETQWNDKNLPTFLKNANLYYNTVVSPSLSNSIYYVEYEYDKKGNWITQIVYEGELKKPLTISERVITY